MWKALQKLTFVDTVVSLWRLFGWGGTVWVALNTIGLPFLASLQARLNWSGLWLLGLAGMILGLATYSGVLWVQERHARRELARVAAKQERRLLKKRRSEVSMVQASDADPLLAVSADRWRQDQEDLKEKGTALAEANDREQLLKGDLKRQEDSATRWKMATDAAMKLASDYNALATDAQNENRELIAVQRDAEIALRGYEVAPKSPSADSMGGIASAETFGIPMLIASGTAYVGTLEERIQDLERRNAKALSILSAVRPGTGKLKLDSFPPSVTEGPPSD